MAGNMVRVARQGDTPMDIDVTGVRTVHELLRKCDKSDESDSEEKYADHKGEMFAKGIDGVSRAVDMDDPIAGFSTFVLTNPLKGG